MAQDISRFSVYGTKILNSSPRYLRLVSIDDFRRENGGMLVAHRHLDLYQIVFVARGSAHARLDERELRVTAPALCLIPPPVIHVFHLNKASHGVSLSIGMELMRDLAGVLLDSPDALPRHAVLLSGRAMAPILAGVEQSFAGLAAELDGAAPYRLAAAYAHLAQLLVQILRSAVLTPARRAPPGGPRPEGPARRAPPGGPRPEGPARRALFMAIFYAS